MKIQESQLGQTLIETLVASFILTMGITASVGLAIYVFSNSGNITKQMIGVGLAREGLDAIKNMRDTNWLQQETIDTTCYNYETGASDTNCYSGWLEEQYCINPSSAACNGSVVTSYYSIGFNQSTPNFWTIRRMNPSTNRQFGLNYDPTASGGRGFYYPCNSANGSSTFYRKITITKRTTGPFDPALYGGAANPGPGLDVKVQVWWTGKKCPRVDDWPGFGKCSVEMENFLTNWKNY